MNVGLPGTGIGGLFYMISVLVMFGYEVVQTTRGRSSGARWRIVGAEMAILAGIFAAIFAVGWLLSFVLGHPIQVVRVNTIPLPAALIGLSWLHPLVDGVLPVLITLTPLILVLLLARGARSILAPDAAQSRSCLAPAARGGPAVPGEFQPVPLTLQRRASARSAGRRGAPARTWRAAGADREDARAHTHPAWRSGYGHREGASDD